MSGILGEEKQIESPRNLTLIEVFVTVANALEAFLSHRVGWKRLHAAFHYC